MDMILVVFLWALAICLFLSVCVAQRQWYIGETVQLSEAGVHAMSLLKHAGDYAKIRLILKRSGDGRVDISKRLSVNGQDYVRLVVDERGYSTAAFDQIAETLGSRNIVFSRDHRRGRRILNIDVGWDEQLAGAIVQVALGEVLGADAHELVRCKKKNLLRRAPL